MRYVLALDQGTTSSRAILFDHDGVVVAYPFDEKTARVTGPPMRLTGTIPIGSIEA